MNKITPKLLASQRAASLYCTVIFSVAFSASTLEARAAVFSASGTDLNGVSVAASANFTASGNTLTILLSNLGTGNINASGDVLTAVFFNIAGSPLTLTPGSALLGTSTVANGGATGGGNVGGEWAYGGSLSGAPASYGISSSGFGIFGQPNFNGLDLSPPPAVDGINYGIVNATYVNGQGNGGINTIALIRNAVTFTLTGLPTGFSANSITSVYFQYGTSLTETRLVGANPDAVPEPSEVLGLLAMTIGGAFTLRRRQLLHSKK